MKGNSSKKFLIITSRSEHTVAWQERKQYVEKFCQALNDKLDDVKVIYTTYQDMLFSIIDSEVSIKDTLNNMDLSSVDYVHFRNWQYDTGETIATALYLESCGVPYMNSEAGSSMPTGKLAQMFKLALNKLPVPDTFSASATEMRKMFSERKLPERFNFPLIIKANEGSRGNDNYLAKDFEQAIRIVSNDGHIKKYIIQKFVPNDGDYRFLFIGADNPPLIFFRKGNDKSHLNNTSKGASGHLVDKDKLPKGYLKLARDATRLFAREVSGVDVLVDKKTRKPYILEVNATPALATGYSTDLKIEHFIKFLRRSMYKDSTQKISPRPIGKTVKIDLTDGNIKGLLAKVDTGAYRSSIWATDIHEKDSKLYFKLLGPRSPLYSGKTVSTDVYKKVKVENSFGHSEYRYSVFLRVHINGRSIKSNFTLANRTTKTYSALVGRKMLRNRFLVDVSKINSLMDEEKHGDDSLE